MAFDFPASPTPGQLFTPPGAPQTYVWQSPRWLVQGVPPTTVVATPPQFDNSTLVANTAWATRKGLQSSGRYSIAADTTLTAAHAGSEIYIAASGLTIVLPVLSTLPAGTQIWFFGGPGASALVRGAAGDSIQTGTASPASLAVNVGDTLLLSAGGAAAPNKWIVQGGSVGLSVAAAMNNWPMAPLFDSTGKLATTAFVNRVGKQYSSYLTPTVNTVLTNAIAGGFVQYGGNITITLPPVTPFPIGATITIWAGAGQGALTCTGSDKMFPPLGAAITSTPIAQGDWVELVALSSASGWVMSNGTLAGAPTPPQFDNGPKLATTGFVQRALGSFRSTVYSTTGGNLSNANIGQYIATSAAGATYVLPPSSGLGSSAVGASITFNNISNANITITTPASDVMVIGNSYSQTTMTLSTGGEITLAYDGGVTWFVSGTGALPYSDMFAHDFNGSIIYQKFPGGNIMQGGIVTYNTANTWQVYSYPKPFGSPYSIITLTPAGGVTYNYGAGVISTTQFQIYCTAGSTTFSWMAFGK